MSEKRSAIRAASLGAGFSRRTFLLLSSLASLASAALRRAAAAPVRDSVPTAEQLAEWNALLAECCEFSLYSALFGRRSRRFGWGMEIPHGPLQFKSDKPPMGLDDFERSLLIAAGLGVSGYHFGIPYAPNERGLATIAARSTGRTVPAALGVGNCDLFYTDDTGTFFVSTRDARDDGNWAHDRLSDAERLIAGVKDRTRRLDPKRIELPREEPHYSAENLWNANVRGSTVFIPVVNVSEQMIAFLFALVGSGYTVFDDVRERPAGDLAPYFKSGLLNPEQKYALSYLEQYVLSCASAEMGIVGHNIALALQTVGLGGWFFSGISPFSLLGASAAQGVRGLGFTFEASPKWGVPNPIGLAGVYEGYCPPFHRDMRTAVQAYVDLKFGAGGTYDLAAPGPFLDNARIKREARPPTPELIDAVATVAEYIHATYGKFPGTIPTIYVRFYTQAHRLETAFYDKFLRDPYLATHARNVARWLKKRA